jgi:hypothetical protein
MSASLVPFFSLKDIDTIEESLTTDQKVNIGYYRNLCYKNRLRKLEL